jgi:hypothetical protein
VTVWPASFFSWLGTSSSRHAFYSKQKMDQQCPINNKIIHDFQMLQVSHTIFHIISSCVQSYSPYHAFFRSRFRQKTFPLCTKIQYMF